MLIVRGRRPASCEISRSQEKTKKSIGAFVYMWLRCGGLNPAYLCMDGLWPAVDQQQTNKEKMETTASSSNGVRHLFFPLLSFSALLPGGVPVCLVFTICTSQLCFPPSPSRQVFGFHFIPCTRPTQLICASIDCPFATPWVGSHGFDFTTQSHVQAGRREGRGRRPRAAAWDGSRTSLALAGVARTPRHMPMSLSMHIGLVVVVLEDDGTVRVVEERGVGGEGRVDRHGHAAARLRVSWGRGPQGQGRGLR